MGVEVAPPPGAKRRDYWWTVLATDPVAVPLVRFLEHKRWVSPDRVTGVALALGLAVGPIFAVGTRTALLAGGIVFYLAFLFDCVDGKLARALGVSSPRGAALDHLADGGRRASGILGLAAYIWRSEGFAPSDIWWVVVYAVLAYYFLEISGAAKDRPPEGLRGRWSAALARRRLLPNPGMPDVQAVVFVLGPVTGFVIPALGVGIAMVAVALALTIRRRLRAT